MKIYYLLFLALMLVSLSLLADDNIATLRGKMPLNEQATPPTMPNVLDKDIKQRRNYPMQPPVIPHKIDNYQIDLRSNKCLSCHNRSQTQSSQAPMVSVTHFMDRDGNFLAAVSPRRYFCTQCHVVQTETKLLIENDFVDMDDILTDKTKR